MWMDLIGLYNYDSSIFDSFNLPESLVSMKDNIIDNILLETAERELIYPDPNFLKNAIDIWSKKPAPIWDELYKTTQYDYNPIWNVDGKIVEDRDLEGTDYRTDNHVTKRTHTDTITRTHLDTDTRTHLDTMTTTHGLTVTTDDSVYGYNSSTKAPESEEVAAQSGQSSDAHTGTITDAHTGTISDAHTGDITDADNGTINHDTSDSGTITTTRTGNIGITSTQSLIKEQREVVEFNIVDVIVDDFSNRFCLKVY